MTVRKKKYGISRVFRGRGNDGSDLDRGESGTQVFPSFLSRPPPHVHHIHTLYKCPWLERERKREEVGHYECTFSSGTMMTFDFPNRIKVCVGCSKWAWVALMVVSDSQPQGRWFESRSFLLKPVYGARATNRWWANDPKAPREKPLFYLFFFPHQIKPPNSVSPSSGGSGSGSGTGSGGSSTLPDQTRMPTAHAHSLHTLSPASLMLTPQQQAHLSAAHLVHTSPFQRTGTLPLPHHHHQVRKKHA